MTKRESSRSMGRPRIVQDPEVVSVHLGKAERRILAQHQRAALQVRESASRSHILRVLIRGSAQPTAKESLQLELRFEQEKQELLRRAEAAEQEAERLKASATAVRKGHRDPVVEALIRNLPLVRDLVTRGHRGPSGVRVLDRYAHQKQYHWKTILAVFERIASGKHPAAGSGPPGGTAT